MKKQPALLLAPTFAVSLFLPLAAGSLVITEPTWRSCKPSFTFPLICYNDRQTSTTITTSTAIRSNTFTKRGFEHSEENRSILMLLPILKTK